MPADPSAAKQFYSQFGDLRKSELIPTFLDEDPSETTLRLELLRWYFSNICNPGTAQHRAYGQTVPIEVPRTVIAPALGVGPGVARELVQLLHGTCEGSLNIVGIRPKDNMTVLILKPTVEEVETLIEWRRDRETAAALSVHLSDRVEIDISGERLGEESPEELERRREGERRRKLKRKLTDSLLPILQLMRESIKEIAAGNLSELDQRIEAERIWHADVYVRDRLFEWAGMPCAQASARRIRAKLRLVDSHERVILDRASQAFTELEKVVIAVSSLSSGTKTTTRQRVIDAVSSQIDAEKELLINLLESQSDSN